MKLISHQMERFDEALSDTQKSLELLPSSFKAMRTLARIRMGKEDFEQAVIDFKAAEEAAQISPEAKPADLKGLADEIKAAEVQLKRSKTKDYYKILG